MAKTWKKLATVAIAATIVIPMAACNKNVDETVTYRTYTSVMPSNWNELTYEDNNDTQILNYIVSSFYEYDFEFDEAKGGKFNEDGTINADAIVSGGFTVNFSAATKLEDVTSSVDAKWGYTDEQKEMGGYAWKITLREDLKWDDGTPIDATDFVYTMQQQLDPLFQNMRASTYYNNITVKNARAYVFQGQADYFDNSGIGYTYDQLELVDGEYQLNGSECYIALTSALDWLGGNSLDAYVTAMPDYFDVEAYTSLKALADEDGNVAPTEEAVTLLGKVITGSPAWGETVENVVNYMFVYYTYPEVAFEDVGMYAPSQYEIVVCLDNPIQCLKEDGSLSYEAAYSFASLPLVKEDLYEECKQEPVAGSTLWTTNYNSSVETSASWGPYKLTQFQGGKSYTLERNEYWYGYNMEENAGQYEVDRIECEQIAEVNTQWMAFLSGEIDEIGLDVDHKEDYRNSKYTLYAPGTGTFGIYLYANLDVLKTNGRNNRILAIQDFRQAISLSFDRDDYNATCYTSHQSCYGILGPSYYYDVENGGVYRDTEYAKKALLRVYGFTENNDGTWTDGVNTYANYEDAYVAMNGLNYELAKQLVEKAYAELTANAEMYNYDDSQPITFIYGTSTDNDSTRRNYEYVKNSIEELVKGTSLEGKIEVTFDASFGSNWANDFKAGAYEIAAGTGFSGGAFDPAGFLQCYIDPDAGLMYSTWWDTTAESLTYTMPEGDYAGAGEELTMSVYNWYACLNGIAESYDQPYTYNWGAGAIPEEARLQLLAELEELVLNKYFTIITTSEYSATVTGAKFSYITDEYNIFMGFGGIRYMFANYNDGEWAKFVSDNGNNLSTEYKKTN